MKLLFFIVSLQCGGAERVCATLCNHWAEKGWDVTLATFDDGSEPPFFPIDTRIRRLTLGIKRRSTSVAHSVLNNLRRVPRLRRLTSAWADAIVVQTEDAVRFFPHAWRRRISGFPNPVAAAAPGSAPHRRADGRRRIVALGRLAPHEGFNLLIDAFASVAGARPEWAELPGAVATSGGAFDGSDLFVPSSRYEGFPNALCEALAGMWEALLHAGGP